MTRVDKSALRKRRYWDLAPSEETRTVRIRAPREAVEWFAALSADERGQLAYRWYVAQAAQLVDSQESLEVP